MVQINYDGEGFRRFNFETNMDERLEIEDLPLYFNHGDRLYFDYENDSGSRVHLIFDKKTSRDDLLDACKRCYRNPSKKK